MPSSNSPSPVKRSVSSPQPPSDHSSTSRQSPSTLGASAHSHSSKPPAHRPHRPHVVGTHKPHARNHSHKNLNKIQKLAFAHNLAAELDKQPQPSHKRHQRKKSAPVSPSTSPKSGQSHVRWNNSSLALSGYAGNAPMRRNLSSPALKRNTSGILVKKNLQPKTGKNTKPELKKSVGFELASEDEDEWEDGSSISAGSTRRNSVVSTKMNGQSGSQAPSTSAKSPLVQKGDTVETSPEPEGFPTKAQLDLKNVMQSGPEPRLQDQDVTAARMLPHSHFSKAPPTISSISATATPAPSDRSPRASSFANLASNLSIAAQSPTQSASSPVNASGSNPNAASSSAEGGISRFLIDNQPRVELRSDSDPSTPSSFLPHYHPRTPPSPETALSRRPGSPKPPRGHAAQPHSRTQQKLWLQRTATLSTSPPEALMSGLPPTITPSVMDPGYMPGAHPRPVSSTYGPDARRFMMGANGSTGGLTAENELKRTRKIYERFTTEFSVVHRFRNPVADSLTRLRELPGLIHTGGNITRPSSSYDLANGTLASRPVSRENGTVPRRQAEVDSQVPNKTSARPSQVRFQEHGDVITSDQDIKPLERVHTETSSILRPGSAPVALPNGEGHIDDADETQPTKTPYRPTEEELLLRRIWESREVAVEGD